MPKCDQPKPEKRQSDSQTSEFPDLRILPTITTPHDLRSLNHQELNRLAGEIRRFLVQSVAQTGGHLGPNLGVVELTIALHRIFDVNRDTFVFDTGHQAYVHKLLTGRQDFSLLRQRGGLSGYPSRAESETDVVENSHASASLAWADGIMKANRLAHRPGWVVAVIGDGAMTGGMAWEALNNIADENEGRLLIVLNDNGRSYAPTIGGLAHHLDALRVTPLYDKTLSWGKKTLRRGGAIGNFLYSGLHAAKAGLRDWFSPESGPLFDEIGITYTGPVDGHDIAALEFSFTRLLASRKPVLVHVITQKGRGYSPAEQNISDHFHAIGRIHPETGLPIEPKRFEWTGVFADEIVHLAERDEKIVALTAAMLQPVGLLPFKKAFPNRVFDVGIAEADAMATAAGLAYGGFHPVFAVYSTFMNRAYDQLLLDVALHHAGVTIVEDRAGVTGSDGASHNGMWDIALAATVPGLHLAAPRDEATLRDELGEAVLVDNAPTLVRYPKGSLPEPIPALRREGSLDVLWESGVATDAATTTVVSTADSSRQRMLLVATGAFAPLGIAAAQMLATDFETLVVDPRWLLPISADLRRIAPDFDWVVTLEDGLAEGGFGSQLRDTLTAAGCFVPVLSYGIPKRFLEHASRAEILVELGLTPDSLVASLKSRTQIRSNLH
ncbi:1-deoxy-D-xylulose-5-phosphate synthase [Mobiluncus mulieris]|uniref:1-deoxy-D-xylulose-5-phosphate synthase n=1 Tax=Mobiluncus mulieris TaxID=2052 RepID=A0A7Y0USZ6_9ACTO|nr:1-deoxy-D-xylulose-5-phosphate synthase [Mobiluncus mulieris]NMX03169.1 1-deoxy-D-xylulose-5-phosphate synthase [Mobiluncus mulieris]